MTRNAEEGVKNNLLPALIPEEPAGQPNLSKKAVGIAFTFFATVATALFTCWNMDGDVRPALAGSLPVAAFADLVRAVPWAATEAGTAAAAAFLVGRRLVLVVVVFFLVMVVWRAEGCDL